MADTVQSFLAKVGVAYVPTDPFAQQYQVIAANNKPAKANAASFSVLVEACLRARQVLYWKKKPGDCGTVSQVSGSKLAQGIHLTDAALGTTSMLSSAGVLSLGAAGGAALGAATLGIGLAAIPVLAITQHHAQAVKTEQQTLCAMSLSANSMIPAIDAAVASGQLSAQQGVDYMNTLVQNLIQGIDSIKKDCNAACVYEGVLRAHLDFASTYYAAIAPRSSYLNNLALPGTGNSLSPASATVGAVTLSPGGTYRTPTVGSSQPFSFSWLLIVGAIIAVVILLIRR